MTDAPLPPSTRPPSSSGTAAPVQPGPPDPAHRHVPRGQPARPRPAWRTGIGRLAGGPLLLLGPLAALGNLSLHTGLSALVTPVVVVITVGFLWQAGSVTSARSQRMVAAAILVSCWLPLRDSSWLIALNSLTTVGLVTAAVAFDRYPTPRLSTRSAGQLITRATAGFAAPFLIARSLPVNALQRRGSSESTVAVLRGLAISVLPVLVLGAFLAQADAVFASALSVDVNAESFIRHAVVSGMVALAVAGLVCVGRVGDNEDPGRPGILGGVELVTVLGCLFLLFSTFAITQALGAVGDVNEILQARGVSHSEYARSGFFQLLTVAALTLLILSVLRAVARPTVGFLDTAARVLGAAVCLLTLLIVVVSIHRLGLYVDAFGQTTLRWYSTAFAWLLGAAFIVFAVRHALAGGREWFGGATVALVVATLLIVNVINPEERVAHHNLTHTATEAELDVWYLVGLSADAWPTLLEYVDKLEDTDSRRIGVPAETVERYCLRAAEQPGWGLAGFNLSRSRLACSTVRG